MKPTRSIILLSVIVTGLSGCLMKREAYELPTIEVPESYARAPAGKQSAALVEETAPSTVPQSVSRWWRHYKNEELNSLVRQGLANNYQLKAAIQRIAQAHALAGVESADEWPELSGSGSYDVSAPVGGTGSVEPGGLYQSEHTYQVGIEIAYELDLWGKNRAKTEAAYQRAWASLFDRETVALTLTADITRNFIELLSIKDRIANANWTRETLANMEEAVAQRVEGGEATNLQLAQQRSAVAASKAVIPVLELQLDQKINAIALLLGKAPGDIKIESKGLGDIQFPDTSPGVPSRLILRRPGIRKIESDMIAADADIDVARAEFLPSIDLSAEAGYGAKHLNLLFSPESILFSAAATLTQIIFDAGRRKSQVKFEEAQHAELVHNYMHAIYTAINEVEDSLSAIRYLGDRKKFQSEAVDAATLAYDFSQESYQIGASDYLTHLDTERTLFTERDELHRVNFERFIATVDLFRALGGSMAPKEVTFTTTVDSNRKSQLPEYFSNVRAVHPVKKFIPNLPKKGHWVHLASLWSEHAAWRHWRRLQQRFPTLLDQMEPEIHPQIMKNQKGTWVSVLAGPFIHQQTAKELCSALWKSGNGCQVMAR